MDDGGATAFAAGMGGLIWRIDSGLRTTSRWAVLRDGSSLASVSISGDAGLAASAHWSASSVALFDTRER